MRDSKKLFIAGLMGSGTTVVQRLLLLLEFGSGIAPYVESWQDPNGVRKWRGRFRKRFPDTTRERIREWVNSYCKQDWFIEKTPTRYTHFLALQELFGEETCFIVVQRDPVQILGGRARTRVHYAIKAGEILTSEHVLVRDKEFAAMWKGKFEGMLRFDRRLRPRLARFQYVRYEDLCDHPCEVAHQILQFLGVSLPQDRIEGVCQQLNIYTRHMHTVDHLQRSLLRSAGKLARQWKYPIPKALSV